MSFDQPDIGTIDGSRFSCLIVAASYNSTLADTLLARTVERLTASGMPSDHIEVLRVPGSNEVPYAIQLGIETGNFDVCIGLGVLIRGDTIHYNVIAQSAGDALQTVALKNRTPVVNGILVAENLEQAEHRIIGDVNRGSEFAECALQLASLRKEREAAK